MDRRIKKIFLCVSVGLFLTTVTSGVCHSAPASSPKPIELTFSTFMPMVYNTAKISREYTKKVETESGGSIRFKWYDSGSLYDARNEFLALSRGDIDMSHPYSIATAGGVPLIGIIDIPFVWKGWDDVSDAMPIIKDYLAKGFLEKDAVLLGVSPTTTNEITAAKKLIRKPEDLKGAIIRVPGKASQKAVEAMGAGATFMGSGEIYLALQRGTIDALIAPFNTSVSRKLYEVAKYVTVVDLSFGANSLLINKATWGKLSHDQQQILTRLGKWWEKEQIRLAIEDYKKGSAFLEKNGMTIYVPTETEMSSFREATKPVLEWWLSEVPEAREVLKKLGRL